MADWITALGTVALAIIAFYVGVKQIKASLVALQEQLKSSREATGYELLLKISDRFDSAKMRKERKLAVSSKGTADEDFQRVFDVLEDVGTLMRKGVLDPHLVWSMFFHWIYHYRHLANDYLTKEREFNKTIYEDFLWLYDEIFAIEKRRNPNINSQPTEKELKDFIEEESNLLSDSD